MKKTRRLLLSWAGVIAVLTVLAVNAIAVEPTLSREDRRGGVTVTATLLSAASSVSSQMPPSSTTSHSPAAVRIAATRSPGSAFQAVSFALASARRPAVTVNVVSRLSPATMADRSSVPLTPAS